MLKKREREKALQSETKTCEQCGKLFSRPAKNKRPGAWSKTRFCGYDCAGLSRAIPCPDIKQCDVCGNDFRKKPREKNPEFNARRTCGRECRAMLRVSPLYFGHPETKLCEHCGRTFKRGRVQPNRWAKKKFCGRRCAVIARNVAGRHVFMIDGVGLDVQDVAHLLGVRKDSALRRITGAKGDVPKALRRRPRADANKARK